MYLYLRFPITAAWQRCLQNMQPAFFTTFLMKCWWKYDAVLMQVWCTFDAGFVQIWNLHLICITFASLFSLRFHLCQKITKIYLFLWRGMYDVLLRCAYLCTCDLGWCTFEICMSLYSWLGMDDAFGRRPNSKKWWTLQPCRMNRGDTYLKDLFWKPREKNSISAMWAYMWGTSFFFTC